MMAPTSLPGQFSGCLSVCLLLTCLETSEGHLRCLHGPQELVPWPCPSLLTSLHSLAWRGPVTMASLPSETGWDLGPST